MFGISLLVWLAVVVAVTALVLVGVIPALTGAYTIVAWAALGVAASGVALVQRWRGSKGKVAPVLSLALSLAVAVVAAFSVIVVISTAEPAHEDAARELAKKGLAVRTITGNDATRPALLAWPLEHDRQTPLPVVVNLHGYGSNYMAQDSYFGMSDLVNDHGFALIIPNGEKDDSGRRFWNANDFCCGVKSDKADDVAYLASLVDDASAWITADGVYAVGLSNGASMAYRLACESLPGLVAVVAMAGSSFTDPERCASASPVSLLHIHGTEDEVIKLEGGVISDHSVGQGRYAAIGELVARWGKRAGCDVASPKSLPSLDLDSGAAGQETTVVRYPCPAGLVVEYWEMESSPHVPKLTPDFGVRVLSWAFSNTTN